MCLDGKSFYKKDILYFYIQVKKFQKYTSPKTTHSGSVHTVLLKQLKKIVVCTESHFGVLKFALLKSSCLYKYVVKTREFQNRKGISERISDHCVQ